MAIRARRGRFGHTRQNRPWSWLSFDLGRVLIKSRPIRGHGQTASRCRYYMIHSIENALMSPSVQLGQTSSRAGTACVAPWVSRCSRSAHSRALMPRSRARRLDLAPTQAICACSATSRRTGNRRLHSSSCCMAASRKRPRLRMMPVGSRSLISSRLALLLPEQKGMPSYFYDVYLFPWFVALWGANNQNACSQLVPAGGHGARSRRGAVDPADD